MQIQLKCPHCNQIFIFDNDKIVGVIPDHKNNTVNTDKTAKYRCSRCGKETSHYGLCKECSQFVIEHKLWANENFDM